MIAQYSLCKFDTYLLCNQLFGLHFACLIDLTYIWPFDPDFDLLCTGSGPFTHQIRILLVKCPYKKHQPFLPTPVMIPSFSLWSTGCEVVVKLETPVVCSGKFIMNVLFLYIISERRPITAVVPAVVEHWSGIWSLLSGCPSGFNVVYVTATDRIYKMPGAINGLVNVHKVVECYTLQSLVPGHTWCWMIATRVAVSLRDTNSRKNTLQCIKCVT